jgi:hypothetical protein
VRHNPESADAPRSTGDDWAEEANRQVAALAVSGATETGIFAEFRRKLAMGEALSRAVAKLAEALRFSGRITVSFHQGHITKTVFEELHVRNRKATEMSP